MSKHLREIERLQHELEQAKAREEQLRLQTKRPRSLRIADKSVSSTRHATKVDDDACLVLVATEKDIDTFEKVAIESPVRQIFQKLVEVDPRIYQTFNFTKLRFSNNNHELKRQGDIVHMGDSEQSQEMQGRRWQSGLSERVVSEQKVYQPGYPDGLDFYKHLGGDEKLAFVYYYKAAHKLRVENLKPALVKEKLFIEVIQRVNENKTKFDPQVKDRYKADEQVTML
ncbi:hypothetical protein HD806DRAFT_527016 [Xylariaceae sp. AK1471]|nr:hypothetical protein HD806DRAFT_527016 [Xylariaceae sp. AK1471]